jgi:transposase InsO family protein
MDEQDQRVRFVIEASRREKTMTQLCREYGVSRTTGHEWRRRYEQGGIREVQEHSRRPRHSPGRTEGETEQRVITLRRQRPDWGARKLQRLLEREGSEISRSTVHRVLLRNGLVREEDRRRPAPRRFERGAPNQLWQMDFKSPKGWGLPVGPLSVCDDHSRYLITLAATGTTRGEAVREQLEEAFLRCGVPEEMLMDHGCPWWNGQGAGGWTRLWVWLMKQGIRCWLSGVRHPQTQGKVERFHGSLEMARRRRGLPAPEQYQAWLDEFRREYNEVRPHEALGDQTPASRWHPSRWRYRPDPPEWDYGSEVEVQRLGKTGQLYLHGRCWPVSEALAHEPVGLIRVRDRILVYYCTSLIRELDLIGQRSVATDRWPQPTMCKGCPDNEV